MQYADITAPIALEAPGCPEVTIERVLRDVVRQLYRENAIWTYWDPAATIGTDGLLVLTLPTDSEVVEVRKIRTSNDEISPRNIDSLAYYDHDDGDASPVAINVNGTWTVRPPPVEATSAKVLVQLAPIYGATQIADVVGQRDRQLYEHSALARILAMPKQRWTDPNMANYHHTAAVGLLFEAKRRADGWKTVRTPTVRYGGI